MTTRTAPRAESAATKLPPLAIGTRVYVRGTANHPGTINGVKRAWWGGRFAEPAAWSYQVDGRGQYHEFYEADDIRPTPWPCARCGKAGQVGESFCVPCLALVRAEATDDVPF